MSFEQRIREDARLIILKALDEQVDGRLNSNLLREVLEVMGITRSRDWVHEELAYLASLGAVTVVEAGTVRVGCLAAKGRDHVHRRAAITGVSRPSPPEA